VIKRARLTELEKFPIEITINLSKYWKDTQLNGALVFLFF
jgi:hypothetical protein